MVLPLQLHPRSLIISAAEGQLYTWGAGEKGQLGHGDLFHVSKPRLVEWLKHRRIFKISAGEYHTAVITQDRKLYVFGDNTHYQLAIDEDSQKYYPIPRELGIDQKWVMNVACGAYHTVRQWVPNTTVVLINCMPGCLHW